MSKKLHTSTTAPRHDQVEMCTHRWTRTGVNMIPFHQSNILVALNAGSSSLKVSVYERAGDASLGLLLSCSVTSITAPPAKFSFREESQSSSKRPLNLDIQSITDHKSAFDHFLDALEKEANVQQDRIAYVLHRLVHGGDYTAPAEINKESIEYLERLSDLAPLHNGPALSVVKASMSTLPNAKCVAYFDSTFHRSLPPHIASFAIDPDVARSRGLKKYGFHGLSYSFILRSVSEYLSQPAEELNLILLHLGSGASACAIKAGKSFDTSMGLTPLHGLPGATRSGSIDPSLIFHYTNKAGRMSHDPNTATDVHVTLAEDILNRKAGWRAMTGTTDFGVITDKADLDNTDPELATRNPYRLAFDLFLDRILDYIGAYHLKLQGRVDALVFAGGIGEKGTQLRQIIGETVQCLGYLPVCPRKNGDASKGIKTVVDISRDRPPEVGSDDSGARQGGTKILVCKTDEQYEMARQCSLDEGIWAHRQ